jgi:regulator of sirC expression with transglutaminase-like and TPR domain
MVALVGTYLNGQVKLDKEFPSKKPLKVIVTFLEEVDVEKSNGIQLSDFSFSKSQKNLIDLKTSLSDSLIDERDGL